MVYTLPTISSLNVPIRRRFPHREPPSSVCSHRRVRRFAGGIRQSMMSYGIQQRSRNRVRPRPSGPVRLPSLHISNFYEKLLIDLPGIKVYGRGGDTCSICMNTYENDRTCQQLPCNHRFHAWCYQKWYLKKHNCPIVSGYILIIFLNSSVVSVSCSTSAFAISSSLSL